MASFPDILVIAGPTASGKTSVGIELAQRIDGEIISADARQIYRFMDIGTAKPTTEERAATRHHLIDFINPDEDYSAGQFAEDASAVIGDILRRGKMPIVVGGAGLYIRALFDGFSPMPKIPIEVRARLKEEGRDCLPALYKRLCEVDPEWAAKIQATDTQRILRGLEVYEASGKPLSEYQKVSPIPPIRHKASYLGLYWEREVLYDRINARACLMFENGLIKEAKSLRDRGYYSDLNALNAFGYREIFQYLDGETTLDRALADLQQGTRRYAKRQMTFFRRDKRFRWVDGSDGDVADVILQNLETC
ncbi:MAG: tRNA (adenosine(37)-N6)-dimethylallyltransferase MiaA [Gemmatimonadetes bacterium]|nr:tRNA (adenosine(37)-N6)-dimethylallyltransferase MiaA [Gemmatimonadota bacterium]MYF73042.1 tRNA (adenosine(37)-N6)-dimethylallyltransferase MiaA [Gemmatimonadota bacterium]MYK52292.1 tRNA (adenosine(37)-N6)-dimethylallyltransferase MiaA [Gemmatimonadota bacterium]